ncbi:restriction endonuclease subunit S [Armatimonas sp.]|uniref:restriction endonuclease subunit S n=1 Tax=Armatimonas sp. TaxID=1872638 RepID=UPI0037502FD2
MVEEVEEQGVTPKLRFPEFQGASKWKVKPLDDICNFLNNRRKPISSSDRERGVYRYYGASGIVDYVKDFIFNERLLLIGEDGAKWGGFEKTAFIVEGKYWVNNHAHVIKTQGINDSLLENYINMLDLGPYVTGAAPPKLTLGKLKTVPVPVPESTKEQQKIADCLSSLDELITAQTQKLNALKTHKKGLMQQLFPAEGETVPKLRFPEFREAGEWDFQPLGVLAENLDNRRIPVTGGDRVRGKIPYYGASGIVDYVNNFIFDEDLLCISEDGANLVARTSPIAFSISGKTWVNNHAHVLRFKNSATQKLVEDYLNSVSLEDFLTGMAQPKLNKAMLDAIPIPMPEKDQEQEKIANCLFSIDEKITAQVQKIQSLKTHKKGLMQQLFPVLDEVLPPPTATAP